MVVSRYTEVKEGKGEKRMNRRKDTVLYGREEGDTERTAKTETLRDELTGALIGLACTCMTNPKTEQTDRLIVEGLALTGKEGEADGETIRQMTARIRREKDLVAPGCAACAERCANTADYDMRKLRETDAEARSLKLQILSDIREIALQISGAELPEERKEKTCAFFQRALFILAQDWEKEQLQPVVSESGEWKQKCRTLTV